MGPSGRVNSLLPNLWTDGLSDDGSWTGLDRSPVLGTTYLEFALFVPSTGLRYLNDVDIVCVCVCLCV